MKSARPLINEIFKKVSNVSSYLTNNTCIANHEAVKSLLHHRERKGLYTVNTYKSAWRVRSLYYIAFRSYATPRGLQLSQQNNLAEMIRIVHHNIAE